MPLVKGSSKEAVSENIRRERDAGKKQSQAVAIALDVARRSKRAIGGQAPTPWQVRSEARNLAHTGPIHSIVPGRTDHHSMSVPAGAYVVPSETVSHLGQNNTNAGMAVLNRMFGPGGPYGVRGSPMKRGAAPRPAAMSKLASGGATEGAEDVPIMAAGGEFVIDPEIVAHIGGGNLADGHAILDKWVMGTRKQHISTLRNLPPPAKN